MDLRPEPGPPPVAAPWRLQLSAARAALDGLQRDLEHVDRVLSRLGDASTNEGHPLHAFAVAVGPRFIQEGREYRLAIRRLLEEIAALEHQPAAERDAP